MDDAAEGYILDGFPRTAAQVEALDGLIGEAGLDHVVVFDVGEDALVERLLSRGRDDDNEETIRTRFQIYLDQTAPLIKTYEERGLILRVEGIGPMDEVTERILDKLGVSAPTEA
jgi:adenylate kinase